MQVFSVIGNFNEILNWDSSMWPWNNPTMVPVFSQSGHGLSNSNSKSKEILWWSEVVRGGTKIPELNIEFTWSGPEMVLE